VIGRESKGVDSGTPWAYARIWVALAAAAFALPAFAVPPALDDWSTVHPYLDGLPQNALQPTKFFRPLEQCLRWVTGRLPEAHIPLMHAATVVGHLVSAWMLHELLRPRGHRIACVAAMLFATSPALGASVWSVDSAIQTWSTAFGLLAVWLYRVHPAGWNAGLWVLASTIAVLWKESGLSWWLLPPWLFAFETLVATGHINWAKLRRATLTGLGLVVGYLILRQVFAEGEGIPIGEGRYSVQLSPVTWLFNALQLAGVSATAADTVALLGEPGRRGWGAFSLLVSSALVAVSGFDVWRTYRVKVASLGLGLVGLAMGPHLLMGHVSEMYAHPIAAAWCLVLSLPGSMVLLRAKRWAVAAFVAMAVPVSALKLTEMIQTGRTAERVGAELVRQWPAEPLPRTLCLVPNAALAERGYSVFQAPPAKAAMWGRALSGQWRWRAPTAYVEGASQDECRATQADGMVYFDAESHGTLLKFETNVAREPSGR
jgi:hypothetical protein